MPNSSSGEKSKVYAVALSYSSIKSVKDYVKENNMKVPVLIGNEKVQAAYKVSAFPTFYFIGKDGSIRAKAVGYTTSLGLWFRSLF